VAKKSTETPEAVEPTIRQVDPTWAEFAAYVREHGKIYVRAAFPYPPLEFIATLWRGVPVLDEPVARLMTADRVWIDFPSKENFR